MIRKLKFENKFLLLYIFLGGCWILFSDHVVLLIVSDTETLSMLQTYKGWFYVLFTALIFFRIIKKHIVKLRNAELKAVRNDQLKTKFIQNISHEIRTPMNAIVGFSELMLDEESIEPETYQFYAKNIAGNSNQLLSIINNVLDISIIESGNIKLKKENIHLHPLIREVLGNLQSVLKEEVTLVYDFPENGEGVEIFTDRTRLQQILNNLIGNALKFTEKGQVSVGYTANKAEVLIFVKDEGIGISKDELSTIFNRFIQSSTGHKNYGGTGLGLAISRELCTLLGGKIWAESELNKGTTFYLTLPLRSE
ncbi:MAG: sensor histidine kinase [Prolixibacteraceae bacterium]